MHLLNVHTLELEQFPHYPPPYATLSHRWGNPEDEISYQDMVQLATRPRVKKKPGFAKILGCREQAIRHGLTYVWIDTCCINQSNSAELSEAINSMWQWYLECHWCFVYMDDVRSDGALDADDSDFARSQWFKRGWTLQELVAPARITFFANDWKHIGRKGHPNVTRRVSLTTGIPEQVLLDGEIHFLSVARRMFWASKRETARKEDRAYSLMGLFDIKMPAIYGGKDDTFVRFQKEIMRNSQDHSMFAWAVGSASTTATTGLLAPSPSFFADVDEIPFDIFAQQFSSLIESDPPPNPVYGDTNNGISITLPMRHVDDSVYLAMLRCTYPRRPIRPLCIYLQMLAGPRNQWVRTRINELVPVPRDGKPFQNRSIFVKEDTSFFDPRRRRRAVSDASSQVSPSPTMRPRLASMSPPLDRPTLSMQDTISKGLAMFTAGKTFASSNVPRWWTGDRPQMPASRGQQLVDVPLRDIPLAKSVSTPSAPPSQEYTNTTRPDYKAFFSNLFSERPITKTWRPQSRMKFRVPEQEQLGGRRLARSQSPALATKKGALGYRPSRSLSPGTLTKDRRKDKKRAAPRGPPVVERSRPLSVLRRASAASARRPPSSQSGVESPQAYPPCEESPEAGLFRGRSLMRKSLRKNRSPVSSLRVQVQTVGTDADEAPEPLPATPSPVPSISVTPSSVGKAKSSKSTPATIQSSGTTLAVVTRRPETPSASSSVSSRAATDAMGSALKPVPSRTESSKLRSVRERVSRAMRKLLRRRQPS